MRVITFCVKKDITFCIEKLLHFALNTLLHFASTLLHFALVLHFVLVLHFAAIVITFCVSITFCGDYYIFQHNNTTLVQDKEDEPANKSRKLHKFQRAFNWVEWGAEKKLMRSQCIRLHP